MPLIEDCAFLSWLVKVPSEHEQLRAELGVSILMLFTSVNLPRNAHKEVLIVASILAMKALTIQPGQPLFLFSLSSLSRSLPHSPLVSDHIPSFPHEGPISDDNSAVADIFGMSDQGITVDMLNRQMMSTGGYHGRPQDEDTMSVRSQDETATCVHLFPSSLSSPSPLLSLQICQCLRLITASLTRFQTPPLAGRNHGRCLSSRFIISMESSVSFVACL
jgi:hypothetical protein